MFYLVEISNGDPKIKGKAVYEYETRNEAVANFHSKLGTAMKSDLYTDDLVMVMDDWGSILECEKYVKTESETQEES